MTRTAANDNHPTGASVRFAVEPRLVPPAKAARRLHLTPAEFASRRTDLQRYGFPLPCPVTGHFDLKAIDLWIDLQSGIAEPAPAIVPVDDFDRRLAAIG